MLKGLQIGKVDLLLQAAEFLENKDKRDRETEHGYATPAYRIGQNFRTKVKTVRRSQNRTSHNELEKNRRAHLRNCLDGLKAIVPLNQDATRHTTLGLLTQARALIENLKHERQAVICEKTRLEEHGALLRHRLHQLEISRRRRDSTGSSWSSGRSESSNDSDKDEEIIDVMDCSEACESLHALQSSVRPNLITINVPKALSLSTRVKQAKIAT
uniref:Not7 n=1 Tax=Ciona intestinalis TaxID=7719 RepID=Q9NDP3_CIOIN|nr:Not7 protein [Ciona intestinalis]BAB00634.1 Not7 [Ciona intestinalis]BAE06542.1 transcription factor protein [Ciona intestinalis]|eukprot:NP_001027611.1 Not7 protein [Ciona intestinalis]